MHRRAAGSAVLVLALLAGLSRAIQLRSGPARGQAFGASYTDQGVPVIYETISGTLSNDKQGATITEGTGSPAVSEQAAVSASWSPKPNGEEPQQIETAYVDWNGTPSWVVSLEGGNVCSPVVGPVALAPGAPACLNFYTDRIDAASGQLLSRFSNGIPVPQSELPSTPIPPFTEILEGVGG